MSSIDVPESLKEKLIRAALRRGYGDQSDPKSQIAEFLTYLLNLDDSIGTTEASAENTQRKPALPDALGLLSEPGRDPLTDEAIDRLLEERRMRH